MKNKKDTKNIEESFDENIEESENSLLDDIDIDDLLADDYSQAIDAIDEEEEPEEEVKPKRRRGRPPKNKAAEDAKNKRAMAKTAKYRKSTTSEQDEEELPAVPHTYSNPESGKKKSNSIFNLILFALIFAALVAAQYIMKSEDKKESNINVSTIEITPEEKLESTEPKVEEAKTVEEQLVEKITEEKEAATEVAEISEEKKVEEVVTKEEVKVEEKTVTETKPEVKESVRRSYQNPYDRPDPYTDGSYADLDGPTARQRYLKENHVEYPRTVYKPQKVVRKYYYDTGEEVYESSSRGYSSSYSTPPRNYYENETYRVKEYKREYPRNDDLDAVCTPYYENKTVYKRTPSESYEKREVVYKDRYTDTSNPWNSGGIHDLDHPSNQPRQIITKRRYEY